MHVRARSIKLSPDRLRRVLKKLRSIGSEHSQSHKGKQNPIARANKQEDDDMLELSAAAGEIDLKYRAGIRVLYVDRSLVTPITSEVSKNA